MAPEYKRKGFSDAVRAAMRETGIGATVLSRKVNDRLGCDTLNRAKVFRYLRAGQHPPASVRLAMLAVLGIDAREIEFTSPDYIEITLRAPGFVRVRADCILEQQQLKQLDSFLQFAKRLRRQTWGDALSTHVLQSNTKRGELARRIADHNKWPSSAAAAMRLSRYLRGAAIPRSPKDQEALCSSLGLSTADLPPLIWEEARVRRKPLVKGTRVQITAVVPESIKHDLFKILRPPSE